MYFARDRKAGVLTSDFRIDDDVSEVQKMEVLWLQTTSSDNIQHIIHRLLRDLLI